MKYKIKRMDLNIAYACNLACKGCISLSDFPRKGVDSYESIVESCKTWSNLLEPEVITIFGGEPLIHPRLLDVLFIIREHWPKCIIRLITNGYLLKKYDPTAWLKFGKFEMQISIHRHDHEGIITKEIKRILSATSGWKPEYPRGTHTQLGFRKGDVLIYKSKFKDFVMPYKIDKGKPVPFKSDPAKAHSICGSPDTPILYKNKLYKCAPIANLLDVADPATYKYQGLTVKDDLEKFVSDINKPESICSMCPENINHSIDHFNKENVIVKNID